MCDPFSIAARRRRETEARLASPIMSRISRTDGAGFMRRDEAWSEITELSPNEFRVRLGGPFRGAWLASLTTRLAVHHISIDHTHARLTGESIWIAELHLIALPNAPDLTTLDYIALAESADGEQQESRPAVARLDTHRLIESRAYGGTLMLTLEAKDTLGLLGSLLAALAAEELFPVEMHIETRGGQAYDSLWLTTTAGAPPNTTQLEAAERLLTSARTGTT